MAKIVRFTSHAEKRDLSLDAFWAEIDQLAQELEESAPPGAKSPLQQLFDDREARMRSLLGEDRDA